LWNCTHFRHPTDEQVQHSYIFSNYHNLQSVHFELYDIQPLKMQKTKQLLGVGELGKHGKAELVPFVGVQNMVGL